MVKAKASFISTQVTSGEYYYLNLTPEKGDNEVVVCGGREQCSPAYRIERNSFKFYSIEFVSSGRGTLTMHGKTHPLRPGAIYCYGPRTKHTIETDPEQPMLKHFVDFTGSALVDLMKSTAFGKGQPLFVSRPFRIRSIFESLITTGNTETMPGMWPPTIKSFRKAHGSAHCSCFWIRHNLAGSGSSSFHIRTVYSI